ncbi:hypothetical protein D3C76_1118230 [compost metagenome]
MQPCCDIQLRFLAELKGPIVACPVFENARTHGVEAHGLMFALSQCQVGESAGQASITILEWVKRDKPEMRDARSQQWIKVWVASACIEPLNESLQLQFQSVSWWCFEMHFGPVQPSGHNLHRLITAQRSHTNIGRQEAVTFGKQQAMPAQQPFQVE